MGVLLKSSRRIEPWRNEGAAASRLRVHPADYGA
jgi:hypothetical protein